MSTKVQINIIGFRMEGRPYYNTANKIESNCNSITFVNIGTDYITVMPLNIKLFPGSQFVVSGNVGEMDKTPYSWFGDNLPGTTKGLLVIRKMYDL